MRHVFSRFGIKYFSLLTTWLLLTALLMTTAHAVSTVAMDSPINHDGASAFNVEFIFSEDYSDGFAEADISANLTNATITQFQRTGPRTYRMELSPLGSNDITFTVQPEAVNPSLVREYIYQIPYTGGFVPTNVLPDTGIWVVLHVDVNSYFYPVVLKGWDTDGRVTGFRINHFSSAAYGTFYRDISLTRPLVRGEEILADGFEPVDGSAAEYAKLTLYYKPAPGNLNAAQMFIQAIDNDGGLEPQTTRGRIQIIPTGTPNAQPSFTSTQVGIAEQDKPYIYHISTHDADDAGSNLTISAPTKPSWLNFADHGDGSATLTGTPDYLRIGPHQVVLTATDDSGAPNGIATQSFTITVYSPGAAPNDADFALTAEDDTYEVVEDGTLMASANEGLLANDGNSEAVLDTLSVQLQDNVQFGTLNLEGDLKGGFTYTPFADFFGEDEFSYKVSNGSEVSETATVSITVSPANDVPIVVNIDPVTLDEDSGYVSVTLSATDVDENLTEFAIKSVPDPSRGRLYKVAPVSGSETALAVNDTISAAHTFGAPTEFFATLYFKPETNFHGTAQARYAAVDDEPDESVEATLTFNVRSANDPPIAVDNTYATFEDTTLVVNMFNGVIVNDSDIDGDPLMAVLLSDVSHGTLVLGEAGNFSYIPDENFVGSDSFTYQAYDGTSNSDPATVVITTHAINDPPLPAADTGYVVNEDGFLAVPPSGGVLANDSDPENDNLRVTSFMVAGMPAPAPPPTIGTQFMIINTDGNVGLLQLNNNGSFSFRPASNFNGPVPTITYTVRDDGMSYDSGSASEVADHQTATANLNISVTPVGDTPTDISLSRLAIDENTDTSEGYVVGILTSIDVEDTDGLTYTITGGLDADKFSVTGSNNDELTITDGVLDHESKPFYEVTIQTEDSDGDTFQKDFTIVVTDINEAPEVTDVTTTVDEDKIISIILKGSDEDGNLTQFTPTITPTLEGTLYSDSSATTALSAVSFVNALRIGDTTDFRATVYFVPKPNWNGTTSFTFSAKDGGAPSLQSNDATATVTVTAINDAPVVTTGLTTEGDEDGGLIEVVLKGSDVDGDLTYFQVTALPAATEGTLYTDDTGSTLLAADTNISAAIDDPATHFKASLWFEPATDFNGDVEFEFTAIDDESATAVAPATFTITVNAIDDAPVVTSGPTIVVDEDTTTPVEITLSGSDEDKNLIQFQITNIPGGATGTLHSDALGTGTALADGATLGAVQEGDSEVYKASVYFKPAPNYVGAASFTFIAVDDSALTSFPAATVSITVNNTNDAPGFDTGADLGNINEEDPINIDILATDIDVGDTLTISAEDVSALPPGVSLEPTTAGATPGTFIATLTGSVASDAVGTYKFTLKVTDDGDPVLSETREFTLVINDITAPVFDSFPTDMDVVLDYPDDSTNVTWAEPTASDNSGDVVEIERTDSNLGNGEDFNLGTHTIAYKITDSSSNSLEKSFTITVTQTPPASVTYKVISAGGGVFEFSSSNDDPDTFLDAIVDATGGTGQSDPLLIKPGAYDVSFISPAEFGIESVVCTSTEAGDDSTFDNLEKSGLINLASGEAVVCTITALDSLAETTAQIGAFLSQRSRIIMENQPSLGRRLQRLSGKVQNSGGVGGFGLTYKDGRLPFDLKLGEKTSSFAYSLLQSQAKAGDPSLSGQLSTDQFGTVDNRKGPTGDAEWEPPTLMGSMAPMAFRPTGKTDSSKSPHSIFRSNLFPEDGLRPGGEGSGGGASGGDGGGGETGKKLAKPSMADFSNNRFDFWIEGTFGEMNTDTGDGEFGIIHAGGDYLITPDTLIGLNLQVDWMNMETSEDGGEAEGHGFMAGPYITTRIAPELVLDARAAWGQSENQISPYGTYEDDFDAQRWLVSGALIGQFEMGVISIEPEARLSWFKEETESYLDSLNVDIPSVSLETGTFAFGPTLRGNLEVGEAQSLRPFITAKGIWTFAQEYSTGTVASGATVEEPTTLAEEGLRARLEFGIDFSRRGDAATAAANLSLSGFYDGLGDDTFDSWGGKLKLGIGF